MPELCKRRQDFEFSLYSEYDTKLYINFNKLSFLEINLVTGYIYYLTMTKIVFLFKITSLGMDM